MVKRKKTGGRKAGTLNRSTAEVKTLAQQHGTDAVAALVAIMRNSTTNDATRIAAIKEFWIVPMASPAAGIT